MMTCCLPNLRTAAPPFGVFSAAQWGPAADGVTDDTTVLQSAIDYAHARNCDLFLPAGEYLVTGLVLPGTVTGTDGRAKAFRLFGQGYGEPFVVAGTGGTVLKSVTDAPVLRDIQDTDPSSNGTVRVDSLRIEAKSDSAPAVQLDSFYGLSVISDLSVYQAGDGDGVAITYSATTDLDNLYVLNSDFASYTLGPSRTGRAVVLATSHDAGLVTMRKVTTRGFHTGFDIGGGAGSEYSLAISECECSVVTDGIKLVGTKSATIEKCYLEGGDGGTGILDQGDHTTIRDCFILPGFSVGIDATDTVAKGSLFEGNTVAVGDKPDAVCIDLASSAAFGGYNKTVRSNTLIYTEGTAGVTGVRISGTEPRVSVIDNAFDPRSDWTGTGSGKIRNEATGSICGLIQDGAGGTEFVTLHKAALSFYKPLAALTEADVSGGVLALPEGSYFRAAPGSTVTVNAFDAGQQSHRLVILRSENTNLTVAATAQNKLNGGANFTGTGTLTLMVERIGALSYAFEISRVAY